jgi:Mu transposase-like protein
MVTDRQVRRLMKLIQTEGSLGVAASKAGMDEKTARKYRRLGKLPSQVKGDRSWRTRADVFKEVWPEVEELLRGEPSIQALTVFEHLCRKYEGEFKACHLRTLQRRTKAWRAQHGPLKEVMFPQNHRPGRQAQSDFTHMKELGVRIQGQPFDHLLYHFVLTYSNWESGSVCFSESFESLSWGLQNALWELGGVPEEHRTDSLSAAINNLSDSEEFTARYQGLLVHYGLRATHNTPGRGHENGDVEQSHNQFKRAVDQELMLRGSREFGCRGEYEEFLGRLVKRRNAMRTERLQEELAVMRRLPERRLEDCTRERVKVSRNSTVKVRNNIYSVDSRLIGESVEMRVYAEQLEVWYGGEMVGQMPRLRGKYGQVINYRHVIHSLGRKPGAFAGYKYQQSLFPRLMYRVAYDELTERHPATADRQYVKILELAAGEGEERVEQVLRGLVERGEPISEARVQELVGRQEEDYRWKIEVKALDLASYDGLLEAKEVA